MNTINFIRTKYEDFSGASYGFRAYDSYGAVYTNGDESPMPTDDYTFFEIIRQNGSLIYRVEDDGPPRVRSQAIKAAAMSQAEELQITRDRLLLHQQ